MDNLAYQEERREEIINGEVVMMAPATVNHSRVASDIFYLFRAYLNGRICEPFPDGVDLYLTEEDHFIPDMMIVCDPNKIKSDGVYGAPDLVVEVLSPSTAKNDRGRKKNVYEKCGVREYWIVNAADKSVEQYVLEDGKFVLRDVLAVYPDYLLAKMSDKERAQVKTAFKCSFYDDLVIHLEDIFARVV